MTNSAAIPGPAPERPRADLSPASHTGNARLLRYEAGRLGFAPDVLGMEHGLEIRVPGRKPVYLSRTPGQDRQLVLGALFTRGWIQSAHDIAEITVCEYTSHTLVQVALKSGLRPVQRRSTALADQGKAEDRPAMDAANTLLTRGAERLLELRARFEQRQKVHHATGAMHGAALFHGSGTLLAFAEDIGRHNALDKAIGMALDQELLGRVDLAVLSSRLALELTRKAMAAGIGILAGFSVATAPSVELAHGKGMTLIGRLKPKGMNIYTHPWRLARLALHTAPTPEAATHEHRTPHV